MAADALVVDASVALKWYLREDGSEAALAVLACGRLLIAPDFLLDEARAVLCRSVPQRIDGGGLLMALADLEQVIDSFAPNAGLRPQALELARELAHSYYDCLYLSLALRTGAALMTADDKFLGKIDASAYRGRTIRLDRFP